MNDIPIFVVGNTVNDVELRFTKSGEPVASFRVATTARRYDSKGSRWIDGDTHYFTVSCWGALAHNVVQTLSKGMPVVVVGRLRSREVERPCKDTSHTVRFFDIEATAVGPDLARGTAVFTRVKRDAVVESERRALADALAAAGLEEGAVVDLETGEITQEAPAA
jgi:single-strand DNA-binding protein